MRYEDEIKMEEEEERRRYEERRRKRKARLKKQRRIRMLILIGVPSAILLVVLLTSYLLKLKYDSENVMAYEIKYVAEAPDYRVDLIDVNEYSRPGTGLASVNGIVIHYTANPGTTAEQNRSYFQNLKDTGETYASSHFVIGIDGEIVQCVPCNEIAYASNERNEDTIAIECCIPDETGEFSEATYQSLVELVTWLMGRYDLGTDDVIRHYDITGKECPKYYVENKDAWVRFKEDLLSYIEVNGIAKSGEIQ